MAHAAILLPPEHVGPTRTHSGTRYARWTSRSRLISSRGVPRISGAIPWTMNGCVFLNSTRRRSTATRCAGRCRHLHFYTHPLGETPFGPMRDCYQVLQRAARIVEQAALPCRQARCPGLSRKISPALRLLAHQIMVCEQIFADPTEAMRLAEHYLRINPTDNHGYRTELVNHCLREGRNQQAAAICAKYPQDMMAETRYGHVLALYRTWRPDRGGSPVKRCRGSFAPRERLPAAQARSQTEAQPPQRQDWRQRPGMDLPRMRWATAGPRRLVVWQWLQRQSSR